MSELSSKSKSLLCSQEDYTFVENLPENGISICKVMENKNTHRKVVFKYNELLSNASCNNDGAAINEFYEYLSDVSQNVHPAINPIEGWCVPNEKRIPIIISSYQPRGCVNLHTIRTLNPTLKWVTAIGISSAINYLHRNHVYNLNLKPSNILLSDDFRPKLSDYGLTSKLQTHMRPNQNIGTIIYMAPELLTKQFPITPKADIYSFGLILYLIFAERCAYNDSDNPLTQIMAFSKGVRPHIFEGVPPVVVDLIKQMWQTNPDYRPTAAAVYDMLINGVRDLVDSLDFDIIVPYLRDIFDYEHGCALASFGDARGKFSAMKVLYNNVDTPNIHKMCLEEIKIIADAGERDARAFMAKITGDGYEDSKEPEKDIKLDLKKKKHKPKAMRPKVPNKEIVEAANSGDREKIRNLLNDDVDVNSIDKDGDTALHVACKKNDLTLAQLLLSIEKIDVNYQNKKGYTPLHEASRMGASEIVNALLLVKEIKLTVPDKMGYSALDWAAKDEIKTALTKAGAESCKAATNAQDTKK